MKLDLSIIRRAKPHISKERVIKYAILALFAFFLILLALDVFIFMFYYNLAARPVIPEAAKQIDISSQKLDKALDMIRGRQ